ncbi:FUSC family protein [Tomitella gaofuii]|uniref:FUSC family protein n=1 Tax=Tomitella gaofuii TaxID=2760083 RepID=UPI0015FB6E19|nr:FUSC family protein [Tomitella gaofuii]
MAGRGLQPTLRRIVVDADPGRIRLRDAWATALAVIIAIAAMGAVAESARKGPELVSVAGFMAMQVVTLVSDASLRQRQATMALSILPSTAAATFAAVTMPHPAAGDVGIVAIVFVSVWLRRYGPRGSACGIIGFFAYFFTVLTGTKPDTLPLLLVAIVVGISSALFVRTAVLPERPHMQLRTLLPTLRNTSAALLDAVIADDSSSHGSSTAAAAGGRSNGSGGSTARTLRVRLGALSKAAAAIYDWQDKFDTGRHANVTAPELAQVVFDVQMSMEHAAHALLRAGPRRDYPRPLSAAVEALRSTMIPAAMPIAAPPIRQRPRSALECTEAATALTGAAGDAAWAVHRAAQAQMHLRSVHLAPGRVARARPSRRARAADPKPAPNPVPVPRRADVADGTASTSRHNGASGTQSPDSRLRLARQPVLAWQSWDAATRAAVQCAVAASVATAIGRVISADRWYWAVLAAFMIFYGTTTSGEVLARAWRRVLGTVLGVVAALVIVYAIGHHPDVLLPLIAVYALASQYLGPLNYAYRVFFITLMLATLYELMGVFDLRVMEIRIDETFAGAAVGIAAAFFVMSTRSTPVLTTRIGDYLAQLDDLVTHCSAALLHGRTQHDLRDASRSLDAALAAVGKAADPLETVGNRQHRRDAARWHRCLQANNRFAHELVGAAVLEAGPADVPPGTAAAFDRVLEHVLGDISAATRVTDPALRVDSRPGRHPAAGPSADRLVEVVLRTLPHSCSGTSSADRLRAAVYALRGIDRTLPEAADPEGALLPA